MYVEAPHTKKSIGKIDQYSIKPIIPNHKIVNFTQSILMVAKKM